jgi:hypothetical protein
MSFVPVSSVPRAAGVIMIIISLFSLFIIIITNDLLTYFRFITGVTVNRIIVPWGLLDFIFKNS